MTPNEALAQWLEENEYLIQLVVIAPRGGAVSPENYIPEGWRLQLQVTEKNAQRNNHVRVSDLPSYQE